MNVKAFYETLAEVYARQTNVKVVKVSVAERQNLSTKREKIKVKCKGA